MLIARIKGGLGNQIFIYAMAKALSLETNRVLKVDPYSGFWRDKYKRQFQLGNLGITCRKIGVPTAAITQLQLKFPRLFPDCQIITEDNFSSLNLSNAQKSFLIDGYWQDENFFKEYRRQIVSEINWPDLKNIESQLPLKEIKEKEQAVCLHARLLRAYASDGSKVTTKDARVLPYSYFNDAIEKMKNLIPNPHFFVFSDSPESFVQNIQTDTIQFTLVQHDYHQRPEVDLFLMSLCRHFIISNSSYSWWAAWISEQEQTQIIAPSQNYWDNLNTVPSRWLILDNEVS